MYFASVVVTTAVAAGAAVVESAGAAVVVLPPVLDALPQPANSMDSRIAGTAFFFFIINLLIYL
jgi:hypothetical protein